MTHLNDFNLVFFFVVFRIKQSHLIIFSQIEDLYLCLLALKIASRISIN